MIRRLVRWCLKTVVEFVSRGEEVKFWAVREGRIVYLAYEDAFGVMHYCGDNTPVQIRDYARSLIRLADAADREAA